MIGLGWALGAYGRPAAARHAKEKAPPPGVLSVTTRLVQVNVVAEDRKGQPVSDLTKDDFILLDNGHEQAISSFAVQINRPTPNAPPAAIPDEVAPNVFSNRQDTRGAPASVTVILLDALNTHFADQVYARAQIVKFLEQIRPDDRIAIYALGSNLQVLHDFTGDARALLAALAHSGAGESPETAASEPAPEPTSITVVTPNPGSAPVSSPAAAARSFEVGFEQYIRETTQKSADFYSMDRTLRTLDALETIARRVAAIPGRKNLVWVSASFPFSVGFGTANQQNVTRGERSFGYEMERAERVLNNANLAIYPVDARGLMGPFAVNLNLSAERSVSAPAPGGVTAEGTPAIEGAGALTPTIDTMKELASSTGGRAFYGSNDIFGAIRSAVDDTRVTYTLGYYPRDVKWDGSFHEIKVRVSRPGVRLLCRRGYFALADDSLDPGRGETALRDAALSPLDATALGLTVRIHRDAVAPDVVDLTVEIDLSRLNFQPINGRQADSLALLFAQLDPQGRMVNGLEQPVTLNLTPEEYQQLLKTGLSVTGRLRIAPGAERLRVVIRESSSGSEGSVAVPLDPYVGAQTAGKTG